MLSDDESLEQPSPLRIVPSTASDGTGDTMPDPQEPLSEEQYCRRCTFKLEAGTSDGYKRHLSVDHCLSAATSAHDILDTRLSKALRVVEAARGVMASEMPRTDTIKDVSLYLEPKRLALYNALAALEPEVGDE